MQLELLRSMEARLPSAAKCKRIDVHTREPTLIQYSLLQTDCKECLSCFITIANLSPQLEGIISIFVTSNCAVNP